MRYNILVGCGDFKGADRFKTESLRQGKFGRTLLDLDRALRQFFGVDGFGETAEMAREEVFGNREEGDIVLRPRETMAFIGIKQICDGDVLVLEGFDHLVRLGLFDPWIIRPLGDEQRLGDPFGLKQRGTFAEEAQSLFRVWIADRPYKLGADGLPIRRYRPDQRFKVRRSDDVDAAGVSLRITGKADEGSIASIASAHDGDLARIGDFLVDRPGDSIEEVIIHASAPFQIASIDEGLAETGRTPEVHAQHRITTVGKPLMNEVESESIACPRTTVNHKHHRLWYLVGAVVRESNIRD